MKRKFIPDNVMELIFGLGAAVVIIGALLKITHSDFFGLVSGNTMLTVGLVTEAVIFALYGIQNFFNLKESDKTGIETISVETQQLQKAVDNTVRGLSNLNTNLSAATTATASIKVPADLEKNSKSLSEGLNSAALNIDEVNQLYNELNKTLKKINSTTTSLDMPEGIGEELQKMKATIKELNAKYEAMLGAMNK
jgi:phage shock protein A